jgi:hypothetical protein
MRIRVIVTAVAAGALAASALSLYVAGRRDGAQAHQMEIDDLTQALDAAQSAAAGERAASARLTAALAKRHQAQVAVAAFIPKALNSEDGHESLAPDRLARLRHADDQLCQAAPELDGCAAAEPAG